MLRGGMCIGKNYHIIQCGAWSFSNDLLRLINAYLYRFTWCSIYGTWWIKGISSSCTAVTRCCAWTLLSQPAKWTDRIACVIWAKAINTPLKRNVCPCREILGLKDEIWRPLLTQLAVGTPKRQSPIILSNNLSRSMVASIWANQPLVHKESRVREWRQIVPRFWQQFEISSVCSIWVAKHFALQRIAPQCWHGT